MAQPMWRSISTIFSTDDVSRRVDVTRFSTPRMTPSEVATPMAVEPSLMASREYSTWKRRPSGEKVLIPRSKKHQRASPESSEAGDGGMVGFRKVNVPYSDLAMNILTASVCE